MAITLADINTVMLRQCFLPWWRQTAADLGIWIPPDWDPSDEELAQLAEKVARAVVEAEEGT